MIDITPNNNRWYKLDDLPNEEWKDIVGYIGYYKVSNYGRIKSLNRPYSKEMIMKFEYHNGYARIVLTKNGIKKHYAVHRLVALAFIPNQTNLPEVNHKDENPSNCRIDNLEWCTHSYNINYGSRNDRVTQKRGRPVDQFSLNGDYIQTFPSISKAAKTIHGNTTSICYCCKYTQHQACGYIWRYHNAKKGGD